jgi:hypothetical protein
MTLASLLLIACSKEREDLVTPSSPVTVTGTKTPPYRPFFALSTFHEQITYPWDPCFGRAKDCARPIMADPTRMAAIDRTFTDVHSGNQALIKARFTTERTDLLTYIAAYDVDGVINGTLKAEARGTDVTKTRHLIFRTTSTDSVEFVYPFMGR